MNGQSRGGFKFRSGSLALDLAATLAKRLGEQPEDLLATPRDLGRWLVDSGVTEDDPQVTREDLECARELREALYRLSIGTIDEQPPDADDLALVNRWAAVAPPSPQLTAEGLTWVHDGAGALLAAVARDGVELLGGPLAERVSRCEGEGCSLLFVDTSHSGARRWCSMAKCGNRAKVSDFRRRQQLARKGKGDP